MLLKEVNIMTGNEIRKQFIDFFKEKGHVEVRSAPVIPFDDPTLLFINAGMNQFKDIFLDKKTAAHQRVVNSQKCIRAGGKHNDLEEVGKDGYHHTFFEMLGNWSFGDYYKKEAIVWAWELFTRVWNIPAEVLYATVHQSDQEAFRIWQEETDIDNAHIEYHGDKDNFWEMGETGPCGPCSEIHIDLGEEFCDLREVKGHECRVNGDCHRFIELWNLVFIQFSRDENGVLQPLSRQYVDTGAGFERLCRVLQKKRTNYETDAFTPIIEGITALSGVDYVTETNGHGISGTKTDSGNLVGGMEHRVIADHIRALCIALADGGYPSNEGRGYVLRRILRRAARYGRLLGIKKPFLHLLTDKVTMTLGETYPELKEKEAYIKTIIKAEEERFNLTLDKGLERFSEICLGVKDNRISGKDAFVLYDTYGFPPDLTELLAEERQLRVDKEGFNREMEKQRELARESSAFKMRNEEENWIVIAEAGETEFAGYKTTATESRIVKYSPQPDGSLKLVLDITPFYAESGGQVADRGKLTTAGTEIDIFEVKRENDLIVHYGRIIRGEIENTLFKAEIDRDYRLQVERNHTATHLLHSALREILGEHVQQKGSLVAADHLRFDFTHFKALSDRETDLAEKLVNRKIRDCIPLRIDLKNYEEAKREGAVALFGEKYEERVRTVKIGDYSYELCGGTHLRYTGEIGLFKIVSESATASGIRRITAITGEKAEEYTRKVEKDLSYLAGILNVPRNQLTDRVIRLTEEQKKLLKEVETLKQQSGGSELNKILESAHSLKTGEGEKDILIAAGRIEVSDNAALRNLGDTLKAKLKSGIGVLGSVIEDKVSLLVVVTPDLTKLIKAGEIAKELSSLLGGKGGGRPDMAMAGGKDVNNLSAVLNYVDKIVSRLLES